MEPLNQRTAVLETDLSTLKDDVAMLRFDIDVLKNDVSVMKADVRTLQRDVATLNTNVAVISSNYITKADLASLENAILKWGFGAVVTLAGIVIAAAKFVR
jgi:ABC-type metal ion transport system substrate-binding protein